LPREIFLDIQQPVQSVSFTTTTSSLVIIFGGAITDLDIDFGLFLGHAADHIPIDESTNKAGQTEQPFCLGDPFRILPPST